MRSRDTLPNQQVAPAFDEIPDHIGAARPGGQQPVEQDEDEGSPRVGTKAGVPLTVSSASGRLASCRRAGRKGWGACNPSQTGLVQ